MNLPTLYHKAKGGELRQWRTWTEGADILTEYGVVGGKLQISRKTAEPKNVGRSNETTPEKQAELEARSLWQYKVERKYSETPEGAQEQLLLPMLAHSYKGPKAKKFQWPGSVQPKLDGVRCLASRDDAGDIILTSRQGKPWNVPHIIEQLGWMPTDSVLDGELYIHGESLQRITSLAKSADPAGKSYKPESIHLEYHVYDIPTFQGSDSLVWKSRAEILEREFQETANVRLVKVTPCLSDTELWNLHRQYISDGYEGAILRGAEGAYLWGYRSAHLLKVKQFQDAEFRVVGATDGRGKMEGHVIWICRNDVNDLTFECQMKVPMAERRRMYEEQNSYIGKLLTVRFFDRTDDSLPHFGVGIAFRDDIDLP